MIQFFGGQPVHICSQSLLFGSLIYCGEGFFPSNIVISIAFRFPQLNWFFDLDILLYVFPLLFPCTYTFECFESCKCIFPSFFLNSAK